MKVADILEFKTAISKNHLSLLAAGLSYYALFALVPAISAIVLLYAFVSDPIEISNHMDKIKDLLPSQMFTIVKGQFIGLANQANHSSLGIGVLISLSLSLWGSSKATRSFMESLNIIEEKTEARSVIRNIATALTLTGMAVLLVLLSLGVIVVVPIVLNFLQLEGSIRTSANFFGWGILVGLMMLFLNLTYRYGPDRSLEEEKKWFYSGSVLATLLWLLISLGFSWYAKEFGKFNKNYGSLGAMIVLMTWFYLSSFSLLLGGQLNKQLAKRTKDEFETFKPIIKGLRPQT